MSRTTTGLMAIGCAAALAHGATAATIHVDDDAPNDPGPNDPLVSDPLEDGSAAHPFDAIAEALAIAVDGDEIVIADGTYAGDGNHTLAFGGRDLTVRGASDQVVIELDAARAGFIVAAGGTTAARLESIAIVNAHGMNTLPALECDAGSALTVVGCTFSDHRSFAELGNAVRIEAGATVSFRDCSFTGNEIDSFEIEVGGAAVYAHDAATAFTSCMFTENMSSGLDDAFGGAVWIDGGTASFTACHATANFAYADENVAGGALVVENTVTPVLITACQFTGNAIAWEGKGGALAAINAALIVRDTEFLMNLVDASCVASGGAVATVSSDARFERCVFRENRCGAGGGCAGSGVAFGGAAATPGATFESCRFVQNRARSNAKFGSASGGAALLDSTYLRCEFRENLAARGGALAQPPVMNPPAAVIESCLFIRNRAEIHGKFEDLPGRGGAISAGTAPTQVRNSTFIGNEAEDSPFEAGSGGAMTKSDAVRVVNCVVRDNVPDQLSNMVNVHSSNVQGIALIDGNIDADPMFVDAANDDLRLLAGSPCIDAGSSLEPYGELDLDGHPRAIDDPATPNTGAGDAPHPDMGAYEYQPIDGACAADLNASGSVDFNDVLVVLGDWGACAGCASDLNGDGAVTLSDLLLVLAAWGPCP